MKMKNTTIRNYKLLPMLLAAALLLGTTVISGLSTANAEDKS